MTVRIRAIFIDPALSQLREGFIAPVVEDLQSAVGGSIEIAHEFPNGDVLYVDEDGLGKAEDALAGRGEAARAYMFDIGAHQPFAGRGIIVGPQDGGGRHGDVLSRPADIAASLVFLVPRAAATQVGPGVLH